MRRARPRGLDGEDVLGAGVELRLVGGNEGLLRIVALEGGERGQCASPHNLLWSAVARHLRKGGIAPSGVAQAGAVDVHRESNALEPEARRLGQQHAIFRRQQVTAEHHVLGGLRGPRAGIDIATDGARALHPHEVSAIVGLGHEFGARRRVQHDLRASQGKVCARRLRRPEVFADLDAEAECGGFRLADFAHFEEQPSLERKRPLPEPRLFGNAHARRKPPLLVELLVVRLGQLRHGADDRAVAADERTVEHPPIRQPPRRTHHETAMVRRPSHLDQRRQRCALEVTAEEQVLAGIAGDRELRKQHHRRIRRRRRVGAQNRGRIGSGVRHRHHRRRRRDPHKAKRTEIHVKKRSRLLDFAVSAKLDGVIGRLGLGQEALSERATVLVALAACRTSPSRRSST